MISRVGHAQSGQGRNGGLPGAGQPQPERRTRDSRALPPSSLSAWCEGLWSFQLVGDGGGLRTLRTLVR